MCEEEYILDGLIDVGVLLVVLDMIEVMNFSD